MDSTNSANNVSCNITHNTRHLSMLSYNSDGWNPIKADFINTILLTHTVHLLALQEHFQLKDNLHKLDCFSNFEIFSVPAFKNNHTVHGGRPSCGISMIYSHELSPYATRLVCPNSHRVQGLKLDFPTAEMLCINAYFPVDSSGNHFNDFELFNTLQDIKYLTGKVTENCTVVLMGDLNFDTSRNSQFAQIVKNFLHENSLLTVWSKFDCNFTYYQERVVRERTVVSKSTIDHFCISSNSLDNATVAMPLHLAANLSKHAPIYLKLNFNITLENPGSNDSNSPPSEKPMWHKSNSLNITNYCNDLKSHLLDIDTDCDALFCRDVHCSSSDHLEKLEMLCNEVLGSITDAVKDNIPHSSCRETPITPGWTEYIHPFKEDSIFWHSVWVSAGRPVDTELHRVMKNCRNKYHYAVRRVRRHEKEIRKSKFLSACLDGKVSDILHDIKASRKQSSKSSAVIDGISNKSDISDHFREIYSDIYNSQNDKDDLKSFIAENSANITDADLNIVDSITPSLVKTIIEKLNYNKNDSVFNWKSDALKHGVDSLALPLCDLLKALIIHGHIPKVFLVCSLVPIVKNSNASKISSTNYRLIAISSLLLKLFDHILLAVSGPQLIPSSLQFGFQKGLSTDMCTWTLTETVNYFRNRGSPIFLCLMDLTKAFDKVKLSILFKKLSGKVPSILLRFLIFSYVNQDCHVLWSGVKSDEFQVSNGVRQGAVASPVLFNTYINELFEELAASGYGCKIDQLYFGAVGYADDLGLLAPCREALQQMVNLCKDFFDRHGIEVSTNLDVAKTKTKIIVFGQSRPANIMLGTKLLPCVNQWPHLGHLLCSDERSVHDLIEKKHTLIGKIHSLRQELSDQDPNVYIKLIRIYLLHLYGGVLWDIFSDDAVQLWTTWHTTVKSLFNLPRPTHRYLVNHISSCDHIKKILIKRFIKFSSTIAASSNPQMSLLHRIQSADWRSSYGRNYMNIIKMTQATDMETVDPMNIVVNPIPPGEEWRLELLSDLLVARDSRPDFLSLEQINLCLEEVCTK